jgi:spore maturation protein CgeB
LRFVIFTHSLVSDWNHGNAHFLRGIATELISRKHDVAIFEPEDSWSRLNLLEDQGVAAIEGFEEAYPDLRSTCYNAESLNLPTVLKDADVVIVHEWSSPHLVARIGRYRAERGQFQLLFHDTHHRSLTAPQEMASFDLRFFDGVLAYGKVIRDTYLQNGWARQAWTWHEAADTRVFHPLPSVAKGGDVVWIGNWGDGERADTLREFIIEPVRKLGLKACIYGVRYPSETIKELAAARIEYKGWLPNYMVPQVFAGYRVTVHVPRGPYVKALPGIPTIRPFEALACGIPLVSAPWNDAEGLFRPNIDYLSAQDGSMMTAHLQTILNDPEVGRDLAAHGRETILGRHTCAHRVDELFSFLEQSKSSTSKS